MESQESFGLRLRAERERLGLSQQRCAKVVDVGVSTWKRWEGDQPMPSDKLAAVGALGFDTVYLVAGIRLEEEVDRRVRLTGQESFLRVFDVVREMGATEALGFESIKTVITYAFIARADKSEIRKVVQSMLEGDAAMKGKTAKGEHAGSASSQTFLAEVHQVGGRDIVNQAPRKKR